jgi:benzoyl-CoA reductase/2-hydroxyglutaryl-CoA dehydratase subunit BcrC/BadD/HgdB
MSSHRVLRDVIAQYYGPLRGDSKEGTVAWVSAFAPVEILRAMGVTCFYPESYSATCSARGLAGSMAATASQSGFSRDLCGYARVFHGALHHGLGPLGQLRPPAFLVATNNQCGTIPAWWEGLGEAVRAPVFTIDYPRESRGLTDAGLAYIRGQHAELVDFVKERTGRPLDPVALEKAVDLSRRASASWSRLQELRKNPGFQGETRTFVDALFPMVVLRGTDLCAGYYETLLGEMATKTGGEPVWPRLLWYGYPCWFLPGRVVLPQPARGRIVVDTYTRWWMFDLAPGDPWQSLARVYGSTYLNRSAEERVRELEVLVLEYGIDAVLVHSNRSCKRAAAADRLALGQLEAMGIPACRFEGDMVDPTIHDRASVDSHVRALLEVLET